MNMLLLLFALCFPLVASAAAPCAVSEKDLVGSWVQKGATGPFEQMMFEVDGGDRVFSSWLHDRPEIAGGRWKLENCLLLVNHPAEKGLAWQFNVAKTKNGQLQVQEPGEKKPAIYRRIKE